MFYCLWKNYFRLFPDLNSWDFNPDQPILKVDIISRYPLKAEIEDKK